MVFDYRVTTLSLIQQEMPAVDKMHTGKTYKSLKSIAILQKQQNNKILHLQNS